MSFCFSIVIFSNSGPLRATNWASLSMTFRSSWSGERRKSHAGRQRRPPKSEGPGAPAPVCRAGVPWGGLRRGRLCTGPDRGHKRAGNAGTRERGRRRTREAAPRSLLGLGIPGGGADQEGIPGREKRSLNSDWASPSGGSGISMAPAAVNDLRRLTIPHQRRLRKPAGSGARKPFTTGLAGCFRPPLTAVAWKPRK